MKIRDFSFGVGILDYEPGPDGELHGPLQRWADSFREIPSPMTLTARESMRGRSDYLVAAQNIDLLAERLPQEFADLRAL